MNSPPTTYFLRHAITKKYLTAAGEWTDDISAALKFDKASAAMVHRQTCGINWAVIDPPLLPPQPPAFNGPDPEKRT